MSRLWKRLTNGIAIGGAVVLALGMGCQAAGARFNSTGSIPIGLYWMSNAPVTKGAYVLFCPPQAAAFEEARARAYIGAGFCPGEYGYMMKRVAGVGGDTVAIDETGVWIHQVLSPLSAQLKADKAGRPMPDNEVLLMSDISARSFDGRYFGPVRRSQIQGVIRPVFTW